MTIRNTSKEEKTVTHIYLRDSDGKVTESRSVNWDGKQSTFAAYKDLKPGEIGNVQAEFVSGGLPPDTSKLVLVVQHGVFTDKFIEFAVPRLFRVGQGTEEKSFVEAYVRNGGGESLRDPVVPPHWYLGDANPAAGGDLFVQEFSGRSGPERMLLVLGKQKGADRVYAISEQIAQAYADMEQQTRATIGMPSSDMVVITAGESAFKTGGVYVAFTGGAISRQQRQVTVLTGEVYKKWEGSGLGKGPLGFPISGPKQPGASGAEESKTEGVVYEFEGGHIYELGSGRTFAVYGPIAKLYQSLGGPRSWLGYPVGDVSKVFGDRKHSDFEGGYIGSMNGRDYEAFPSSAQIAISVSVGDDLDIYMINVDGSNPKNATGHLRLPRDSYPAWSPDGTKLAFNSGPVCCHAPWEIFVLDIQSSIVVNLTSNNVNDSNPAWAPSGTMVAFVSDTLNHDADLYVINIDGTGRKNITGSRFLILESPSWSPDGKWIAFWGDDPTAGGGGLYIAASDGSSLDLIVPDKTPYGEVAWEPNGERILFASERSGRDTFYTTKPDGSDLRPMLSTTVGANPAWSPDGHYIAFLRDHAVWVMEVKTGSAMRVTGDEMYVAQYNLSWSPSPVKALATSIAFGKRVSPEFKTKVVEVSSRLGVNPDYLMAAMFFETGGTFSPTATNSASGAIGLIQFLPSTATGLGTSVEILRQMTAVEQLGYVEKYFQPYKGKLASVDDVYMAILWPKAIGQPSDYVLFATPSLEYSQNRGLDLNGDGMITKAEASEKVQLAFKHGLEPQNRG